MSKHLLLTASLLFWISTHSQNLVSNGDFEQYAACPTGTSQLQGYATGLTNPSTSTPDYFNECNTSIVGVPSNTRGWQNAHSGVGYCGMVTARQNSNLDFREYVQLPLESQLTAGACYDVEFFINLAEVAQYNSENIGVYFSDIQLGGYPSSQPLPFTPQIDNVVGNLPDTASWTLVSGSFTANGTENFVIVGNFRNAANSNTILVNAGSTTNAAYVFVDDVSVSECSIGIDENGNSQVSIFPNPMNDILNVQISNSEPSEILIYDLASRIMVQQQFMNSISVSTADFAPGLYLIELRSNGELIRKAKVAKE